MHSHFDFDAAPPKRPKVSPSVERGPRESPRAADVWDDASGVNQFVSLVLQNLEEIRLGIDNVRDMQRYVESMLDQQGIFSPHEKRQFRQRMLTDVEKDIRDKITLVYQGQGDLDLSLAQQCGHARASDRKMADLAWEVCQECTKGLETGSASIHDRQYSQVRRCSSSISSADREGSVVSAEMSEDAKTLQEKVVDLMTLSVVRNTLVSLSPSM
jgi:hypothetical protein